MMDIRNTGVAVRPIDVTDQSICLDAICRRSESQRPDSYAKAINRHLCHLQSQFGCSTKSEMLDKHFGGNIAAAIRLAAKSSHTPPGTNREVMQKRVNERGSVNMEKLKEHLFSLKNGLIAKTVDVELLLSKVWDQFGGHEGGMVGSKLIGRMEDVSWNNPLLTFEIERHGGTVHGSTRAEIQHWCVNVEVGIATIQKTAHRQLYLTDDRVTKKEMEGLAAELVNAIKAGQNIEPLCWKGDGTVHVNISKMFPLNSGCKRTVENRRRRMRDLLANALKNERFECLGRNVFRQCT